MFKKSLIISIVFASISFAGEKEPVSVELGKLLASPEAHLGQVIQTTGTVDHVCKHGGKKMLIFASNPEESIHVTASEKVPVFDAEANGSDVLIIGVVKENRITKAQVLKFIEEKELAEKKGNAKPSVSKGEGLGHGQEKHKEEASSCGDHPMLKEMEATGKDYVSDYYIECVSYNVKTS